LAVVPRSQALRRQRLDILTELARAGFGRVDLVFLDTDDILLKFEAVRANRLIYQAGDFDRNTFYSKIIRQYLDFQYYLDRHRQAYKESIRHGQERGH
jgi:uncharacterized protein